MHLTHIGKVLLGRAGQHKHRLDGRGQARHPWACIQDDLIVAAASTDNLLLFDHIAQVAITPPRAGPVRCSAGRIARLHAPWFAPLAAIGGGAVLPLATAVGIAGAEDGGGARVYKEPARAIGINIRVRRIDQRDWEAIC